MEGAGAVHVAAPEELLVGDVVGEDRRAVEDGVELPLPRQRVEHRGIADVALDVRQPLVPGLVGLQIDAHHGSARIEQALPEDATEEARPSGDQERGHGGHPHRTTARGASGFPGGSRSR